MASFSRNRSGTWRAQVRRGSFSTGKTFKRKVDAVAWATEIENGINDGQGLPVAARKRTLTMSYLIDQHIKGASDAGKAPKRSKAVHLNVSTRTSMEIRDGSFQ